MECRDNKCQCKINFKYDGAQCLGSLGMYLHTIVTVCSEYEAPAAARMRNITFSLCIVIRWINYMKCISKVLNKIFTDIPAMRFETEVTKPLILVSIIFLTF
jgi:hypothetical protein